MGAPLDRFFFLFVEEQSRRGLQPSPMCVAGSKACANEKAQVRSKASWLWHCTLQIEMEPETPFIFVWSPVVGLHADAPGLRGTCVLGMPNLSCCQSCPETCVTAFGVVAQSSLGSGSKQRPNRKLNLRANLKVLKTHVKAQNQTCQAAHRHEHTPLLLLAGFQPARALHLRQKSARQARSLYLRRQADACQQVGNKWV